MDNDEVTAVLAEIDADIAAAEYALEKLQLQRVGAEAFLARVNRQRSRGATGRVTPSTGAEAGNKDFVAGLLVDYPDGLHLDKIRALASEHGRQLDSEQVRSAVTYLKRRGQAEAVTRGVWRLVGSGGTTDTSAPVATGAEASETTRARGGEDTSGHDDHDPNHHSPEWDRDRRGDPAIGGMTSAY